MEKQAVEEKIALMLPLLNEKQRRIYLASDLNSAKMLTYADKYGVKM